jgi:hypothetical protein
LLRLRSSTEPRPSTLTGWRPYRRRLGPWITPDPAADAPTATRVCHHHQPHEPEPEITSPPHLPGPQKHPPRIIAKAQVDYRHMWHYVADPRCWIATFRGAVLGRTRR